MFLSLHFFYLHFFSYFHALLATSNTHLLFFYILFSITFSFCSLFCPFSPQRLTKATLLKRSIFPNNNSLVPEDSTVSRRTVPTNRCGWASGGTGTTIKLLATGWIEARRCKSMHSFCSPIVRVLSRSQKFSYCLYPNTTKMYSERDGMLYRLAFLFHIIWESLDLDNI